MLDGHAMFLIPKRGAYHKNVDYAWSLNGQDGMHLGSWGSFRAQMHFRIIDADPAKHEEPLRVTTRSYAYAYRKPDGTDAWRIHWHPVGNSPAKGPHIHLPPTYNEHLPTGRVTFEQTIMWCIEYGAPLRCERAEALNRLAAAEAPHVLFRSWSDQPPAELR
ncbi:hypothetical protein [Saccharopolyspora sp. NPDC002376]